MATKVNILAFPDGIILHKDTIYRMPAYNGIDLLHSIDGTGTVQGVEKGRSAKERLVSNFLKLMVP